MKNHYLKSMTDFVIEMDRSDFEDQADFLHYQVECAGKIRNYADFLKRQPTKGDFVPCDLEGNVLDEPVCDCSKNDSCSFNEDYIKYQQAKERVLFKGFEIVEGYLYYCDFMVYHIDELDGKTIECMLEYIPDVNGIELTDTAVKMLGYE